MMKKRLAIDGVKASQAVEYGESYSRLFHYFAPECITALVLYSLPFLLDAYFIGQFKSTIEYGTLGGIKQLMHFVIKIAEAISVGTVIICGYNNGLGELKQVGRTLRDAFWLTCLLGLFFSSALYFGASSICTWYFRPELVPVGVPFLQLHAVGVLFMFMFFALTGFLRGIKNTQAPMRIFMIGAMIFVLCDWLFIFGKFGMPEMGLQGSAAAFVVQYAVMLSIALLRILSSAKYRKYGIQLFAFDGIVSDWKRLLKLSAPVVLDKGSIAFSYIWLTKMVQVLGTEGIAAFDTIKNMERFALIPAAALAQIITFLVSNDTGIKNWRGIKSNMRKIIYMASVMVMTILLVFAWNPTPIIACFDGQCQFTSLAVRVFPLLSVLAFFDLLQLILSGALRGSANVNVVMVTRLLVSFGYFVPVSYYLSTLPIEDVGLKLLLIYGSFYIGSAFMSFTYIRWFRGRAWKRMQSL